MIKLPENPKDRQKVLALLALAGGAVLFLGLTFGIKPYLEDMRQRRERIEELEHSIWRATNELNAMEHNQKENREILDALLAISETRRHILRPSLGNYLLVASEQIKQVADDLRIALTDISEVPLPAAAPTPVRDRKNNRGQDAATTRVSRFSTYTVSIGFSAGLHTLVRFLDRIENRNPYLTVTRITIIGQSDTDPEQHLINMHLQWPIWADPEFPRRLEAERLADEES